MCHSQNIGDHEFPFLKDVIRKNVIYQDILLRDSAGREHDSDFREIVTNSGPIRHNWKMEKFRIELGENTHLSFYIRLKK